MQPQRIQLWVMSVATVLAVLVSPADCSAQRTRFRTTGVVPNPPDESADMSRLDRVNYGLEFAQVGAETTCGTSR